MGRLLGDKCEDLILILFDDGFARESQRFEGIGIKEELFIFFVYFVSLSRSVSPEILLLGHWVVLQLVIVHSQTHFIQKVDEKRLGLGQGNLQEEQNQPGHVPTPTRVQWTRGRTAS